MAKKSKIMVVDDEERNLRLMEALMIPLGYDVTLVNNGLDAIKMATDSPPDVILLDIMMPKMDGYEVARRLKENEKTKIIPIVIVTALKDVDDRVRALEAGADDFLTKPVDHIVLNARMRSLIKVKAYNDHMVNYQKTLENEVEKRTNDLEIALDKVKKASLETIYRLSLASEYKDEDTGVHVLRMSNYAAAIARKMGFDEKTIETILYASPMHDVGKIGIPDRILLKPGKFTPEEWKIMKQHTVMGARILENSKSEYINMAEIIALTHHEKWDGNGYPEGLKGEQIPLVGRITALADVFDALTSKRPYKAAFSLEKSFGIIKESTGTHFDPGVVEAFFSIIDEVLEIKEKYKNEGQSLLLKMVGNLGD